MKPGILLHEDVIDVVGLLLRGGFVLGPDRLEADHFIGARKDIHQRGHQPLDGVGDIGRNRARAAVLRWHVLAHIAEIIIHRVGAIFHQPRRRDRRQRVGLLGGQHGFQIGIDIFVMGKSGLKGTGI